MPPFAPAVGTVGADALRKRQATKPRVPATSISQNAGPSPVAIQRTDVPSGSSASTAPREPGSVRRLTSAALIQRASSAPNALIEQSAPRRNDRPRRERMVMESEPG